MNTVFATQTTPVVKADFRAYLERSLRDPFTLNLKDCTLIEVIRACINAKSKMRPTYGEHLGTLLHNLRLLETEYRVVLHPIQVTDIFWGYFIGFCQGRGLKTSTIATICNQLRSVLNWGVKYNVSVSPTYNDILIPKVHPAEIALTADEISHITYFDCDLFYANRRSDYRDTMTKVRDMFVLSTMLFQRHSDMVRISPTCFDRNIFTIVQQKTGNRAVVDIDKYSIEPKTAYRLIEKYGGYAPYTSGIGNYNYALHQLMKDIGFTENIRVEDRVGGKLVIEEVPKYKMVTSHTSRRSAISINVMRGHNITAIRRCSGHEDLRSLQTYVKYEE